MPFFLSIFLNPRVLLTMAIVGVISYGIWKWNSMESEIIELTKELKNTELENQVLNSELANKDDILENIRENNERVKEINDNLMRTLESNNREVRNLRTKLDSLDLENSMQTDPERVSKTFSTGWKLRVDCIEAASGKKDIECVD